MQISLDRFIRKSASSERTFLISWKVSHTNLIKPQIPSKIVDNISTYMNFNIHVIHIDYWFIKFIGYFLLIILHIYGCSYSRRYWKKFWKTMRKTITQKLTVVMPRKKAVVNLWTLALVLIIFCRFFRTLKSLGF